jgi:hypothetical protein
MSLFKPALTDWVFGLKLNRITYLTLIFVFLRLSASAQDSKVNPALYDGLINAGYVDNGFFLNLGGPNLNLSFPNSKILVGMFPSLRFKEDKGIPKNSFVTPALGLGVTYLYKSVALHLPLYYNAKTPKENGKWNLGIGLGFKISSLNKK